MRCRITLRDGWPALEIPDTLCQESTPSYTDAGQQTALDHPAPAGVDSRGWRDTSESLAALPTLFEALWTSRRVRFEYESALHEAGERVVDPLGLVVKGS